MATPEGFIQEPLSEEEMAKNRASLEQEPEGLVYEIPTKEETKPEPKVEDEYSPTMSANQRKEYFVHNRQFRDLAKEYARDYLAGKTEILDFYLPDLRNIVEEEFLSAENPRDVVFQALREILGNSNIAQKLADSLEQEFSPVN